MLLLIHFEIQTTTTIIVLYKGEQFHTEARQLDGTENDALHGSELAGVELLREVEYGLDESGRQEHLHPPLRVSRTARQSHETVIMVH